jgi:hypothetical protein
MWGRTAGTLALLLMTASAHADSLADRARPLVEAAHAERRAIDLGRYLSRGRWDELLDESLYLLAPKGTWGPEHPAWSAARAALARELRAGSVAKLNGETGDLIRSVLYEKYSSLEPKEAAKAVAFYESPGGRVFRAFRELVLAENAYGLPYVIETESHEAMKKRLEDAKQKLLNLPDEQTSAVYDFNHTKTGELLMAMENNMIADIVGNIMRSDVTALMYHEGGQDILKKVRAAVPQAPPRSDKEYLGTVTMRSDRGIDLKIEYHENFRLAGTYDLTYAKSSPEWQDVTAAVPALQPGETRFLYRDPAGKLGDAP